MLAEGSAALTRVESGSLTGRIPDDARDEQAHPCGWPDCDFHGVISVKMSFNFAAGGLDYKAVMGWLCGSHYEMLVSGATFRYAGVEK